MRNKIILAVATVLFVLTTAWAADVAGKWTAKASAQGGGEITFVFKLADDKLTGTVNNSLAPGEAEIQDAKISGDDISFSLKRSINGTDTVVNWKGKISGDEIKFTRTQGAAGATAGTPTEFVAKRVK